MGSISIGTLMASIGGDITPLKGALNNANIALNKFSDQAEKNAEALKNQFRGLTKIGDSIAGVGKKMSLGLTLPIGAAGVASFKLASDLEENINKTMVAFRGSGDEVLKWSDTTLKSFGIAKSSALDMASLFGDMSTSMGLTGPEAAKMSTSLVGLAGDLASFKNIGTDMASTALKGIFTGETEALKGLGIVMTEDNLKAFAMSQGIKENIKDMSQAEKVNLRYAYVMANTTNAQGDFLRTSGGAANQMRIFTESLKQIGAQFGAIVLPAITSMITKVNSLMTWISSLDDTTKKWVVGIGIAVAAIGPMLLMIGKIITLIPILKTGLTGIKTVMTLIGKIPPFGLWGIAIAAVIAGIVLLWKKCDTFRAVVKYVAQNISAFFQKAWIEIKMGAELMWLGIKTYFTAIPKLAEVIWNTIKRVMKGESIGTAFKDELSKVITTVTDEAKGIKDKYNAELEGIKPVSFADILAKEKAIPEAKKAGEEIGASLTDGITAGATGLGGTGVGTSARGETSQKMESKTDGISVTSSTLNSGELMKVADAYQIVDKSINNVSDSFNKAKTNAELFGEPFDANKTKLESLKTELDRLTAEGLPANKAAIEKLGEEYRNLSSSINTAGQASINIGQMMSTSLSQGFATMGESLGQMMAGTGTLQSGLQAMLGIVLDFGAEFGKALIAVGIGKMALDKLIQTPGGAALAIAAGVALTALVGYAKSKLEGGLSGGGGDGSTQSGSLSSVPALATGGLAYGPTYAQVGDNPQARFDPEFIAPVSQVGKYLNQSGGSSDLPSYITLTVRGEDLEAVLNLRDKRSRNMR